ncbi:MAG TPA: hypothetical protein VL614_10000 [Acetobacteraceae bacterium]|nr:hypothetical protein [Acetobacteraceae bacterium]
MRKNVAVFVSVRCVWHGQAKRLQAEAANSDARFRETDHRIKNTLRISAAVLARLLEAVIDPVAKGIDAVAAFMASISIGGGADRVPADD